MWNFCLARGVTDRVAIHGLTHQGNGLASVNGTQQVFVDGAAPGDIVSLAVDGTQAKITAVHVASPHRVTPLCQHAATCGGCAVQHLSDAFIAEWKREQVITALAHRGMDARVEQTLTVPPRSRRRAVFAARRSAGGVVLGFHAKACRHIVAVRQCEVVQPVIAQALEPLAKLLDIGLTRRGEARMTVTATATGLDVAVAMPGRALDGRLRAQLSQAGHSAGLARLTWNDEQVAQWRVPVISFDGLDCRPPAGGFLQAVEQAEAAMRAVTLKALAGAGRVKRVLDLFSGCGAFALPLARHAQVDAFDSDALAIAALERAHRSAQRLKPLNAVHRDLFRRPLLPDDLAPYDFAVIDPPRAGAKAQMAQLAKSSIPVIISMSCNPATFARDARLLLDAGYRMGDILPIDQFRWSAHVELVAVFKRP